MKFTNIYLESVENTKSNIIIMFYFHTKRYLVTFDVHRRIRRLHVSVSTFVFILFIYYVFDVFAIIIHDLNSLGDTIFLRNFLQSTIDEICPTPSECAISSAQIIVLRIFQFVFFYQRQPLIGIIYRHALSDRI